MISVESALEVILREINPLGPESVDISSGLGRVLAEDIAARWGNPPFDNSAMDGYAVRTIDVKGASLETPVKLSVIYDLPAGSVPQGPVGPGQAVRIMTGAPVPDGADAVVMVEKTESGDGSVLIKAEPRVKENIRKAGEDFKAGDIVIKKGSVLRPAEAGMLATVGVPFVMVHRKPRVAVISTGDELCDINEQPGPGKIVNSNGYALAVLVAASGAVPIQLGIARDTKESLREKLKTALAADCIISSGGVSVGDYDFVKDVLKDMGSSMIFWKVAMKPGKPLAFGVIGGKPAFGLPGNPISSMVAFEQFVRPSILKMAGRTNIFRQSFKATLTNDIKIKPGRMNFIRAELKSTDTGLSATALDGQGSGMVLTMVRANSFIIVPQDSTGFKSGDTVRAQPFDDTVFASEKPSY